MNQAQITKEQEIEMAYEQLAKQKQAEKDLAWQKADRELQHQQKQSV